ncbi:MAG: hypothetical protein WCO78_00895 [Candidatus Roizmanbacteria bacterium]
MPEDFTPEEYIKPLHDAQALATEFTTSAHRITTAIERPQSNLAQPVDKINPRLATFKEDPRVKHFFEPTDANIEGSPTRIEAAFPGLIELFLGDKIWDMLDPQQPKDKNSNKKWFDTDALGTRHIYPEGYIKLYSEMSRKLGNKQIDPSRSKVWNEFGAAAQAMHLTDPPIPDSGPVEIYSILGAVEVMVNDKARAYLEDLKNKAKLIEKTKSERVVSTGTDTQEMRTGWGFDRQGRIELDTTFSLLHGVKREELPFGGENTMMTFRQILGDIQLAVTEGHDAVKETLDVLTDTAVITPETQTRFVNHLRKSIAQETDPKRKAFLENIALEIKTEPVVHNPRIEALFAQLNAMDVSHISDKETREKARDALIDPVSKELGMSKEVIKNQLGRLASGVNTRVVFDPEATRGAMKEFFDLSEINKNMDDAKGPGKSEKERDVERTLINRYMMDWGQIIYGTEGYEKKNKKLNFTDLGGGDLTNPAEVRKLTSEVATDLRAAEVLMDQLLPDTEKLIILKLRAELATIYARPIGKESRLHINTYYKALKAQESDAAVVLPFLSGEELKWINDVAEKQKAILDTRASLESAVLVAHGVKIDRTKMKSSASTELILAIQAKRDVMKGITMEHAVDTQALIAQIYTDTGIPDEVRATMKTILENDAEHEKRRVNKLKTLYGTHLTKMLIVGQAYDMGLKGIEYRYRQQQAEVVKSDAIVEKPLPELHMPKSAPLWEQMAQSDIRVSESNGIKPPLPKDGEAPILSLRDQLKNKGTPEAQQVANVLALSVKEEELITEEARVIISQDTALTVRSTENPPPDELTTTGAVLEATWRYYRDPATSLGEKIKRIQADQSKLIKRADQLVDEVHEIPVVGPWLKSLTTQLRATNILGSGLDDGERLSPSKRVEKFALLMVESLVSQSLVAGDLVTDGSMTSVVEVAKQLKDIIVEIKAGNKDPQEIVDVLLPKALDVAISKVKDPRTKLILTVMKKFIMSTKTGNHDELKKLIGETIKRQIEAANKPPPESS